MRTDRMAGASAASVATTIRNDQVPDHLVPRVARVTGPFGKWKRVVATMGVTA